MKSGSRETKHQTAADDRNVSAFLGKKQVRAQSSTVESAEAKKKRVDNIKTTQ